VRLRKFGSFCSCPASFCRGRFFSFIDTSNYP
jgi:hypothetical protein